jgi:translation initiation factor eIF-2B subunit alpha
MPSQKGRIICAFFSPDETYFTVYHLPSYKFHRLFPLSQYDLPTHNPGILSFPRTTRSPSDLTALSPSHSVSQQHETTTNPKDSPSTVLMPLNMTPEQISRNPDVDYTRYLLSFLSKVLHDVDSCMRRPDLITLVFSDVGYLTPEGVSQYLVGMFAG